MDESDFDGTLILEKMAEIGKLDAFFDAIDSDQFSRVKNLMKLARIDAETIAWVFQKMRDGSAE